MLGPTYIGNEWGVLISDWIWNHGNPLTCHTNLGWSSFGWVLNWQDLWVLLCPQVCTSYSVSEDFDLSCPWWKTILCTFFAESFEYQYWCDLAEKCIQHKKYNSIPLKMLFLPISLLSFLCWLLTYSEVILNMDRPIMGVMISAFYWYTPKKSISTEQSRRHQFLPTLFYLYR